MSLLDKYSANHPPQSQYEEERVCGVPKLKHPLFPFPAKVKRKTKPHALLFGSIIQISMAFMLNKIDMTHSCLLFC